MTDYRNAHFGEVDMSGAQFRETDLTGARMYGVLLINADIDGAINGLRVNGVEVAPLIEAELDRRHPERVRLRPTTVEESRLALATVRELWEPTLVRAAGMAPSDLDRSVNDEWSFLQTLRHLVFVVDAWLLAAVLGDPKPFHPLGLPASFMTDHARFGTDPDARPPLSQVLAARDDRLERLRSFLDTATQDDLDRVRPPGPDAAWPPPQPRVAMRCLQTIFNEEWAHHQFAVRDLAIIEAGSTSG